MKISLVTLFGEEANQHNALYTALENAANSDGVDVYDYLDSTPKTSLIVELIDELNQLGFEIKRKLS